MVTHKNKSNLKKKTKRLFNKKDYLSGDGMLTSVWGPSFWHSLHTMSFNYPVNPTVDDKKNYKQFILLLKDILPCRICRNNLKKNFKNLPLTNNAMKNRESFSRYVYNLHELVNKMLGKNSGLSYCDVRDRYEHFRSRCTVDLKENKESEIKKHIRKTKKKKEKGCTEPLYGKKSKCLIRIVPLETKNKTLVIDNKCLKKIK
jgi:hypothetical protein